MRPQSGSSGHRHHRVACDREGHSQVKRVCERVREPMFRSLQLMDSALVGILEQRVELKDEPQFVRCGRLFVVV